MFHLGLMYRRTHNFSDALRMFSKVESKLPNDKTVYIQRGLVFQDMKNHQAAIRDFEKAIDPACLSTHADKWMEQLDKAKTQFEKELKVLEFNSNKIGIIKLENKFVAIGGKLPETV
jgi:tetratricopeptide (TPR) repeat protein